MLWLVMTLNMAYADILSAYIPEAHEELATFAGDTPIKTIMFFGALIVEIPILMIFLARILPYKTNRWANIIAAGIKIVLVIAGGSLYPHYVFIATIEVAIMLLIIWYAWNWPIPEDGVPATNSSH